MSCLSSYDEAVLKYISDIKVNDGIETRYAQALLATPSRKGVKLVTNKNSTPVMPFLVLTRTGLSPRADTHLVKGHNTRNARFSSMSSNIKSYDMVETMGYDYNYQVNFFALQQEMFNQMVEQLLFKTEKNHYVTVNIESANFNLIDHAYVSNISYTDSTGYSQISDNSYRIFNGLLSFTVNGFIINEFVGAKSVLHIEDAINSNMGESVRVSGYDGTLEELVEYREKGQLIDWEDNPYKIHGKVYKDE